VKTELNVDIEENYKIKLKKDKDRGYNNEPQTCDDVVG
jgi:hypothetical protein